MVVWAERKAIQNAVEEIAACKIVDKFYPTIIAKRSGISIEKTFDYLLTFVKEQMLIVKWEIRCDCARTVQLLEVLPEQYDNSILDCDCGEDVEVTLDNTYPVFEFAEDYRESCIKERLEPAKKKQGVQKSRYLN
ncbi:hypothetical protein [Anaeroarcus burkinensis]|uniref:hypothetical protein n=1 Tax=Anaeroarcus burkinensis TaxID=82376 RepID=UPI0004113685|nr:hypothetical protein [Anaeroarcus burkinensis]